MMKESNRSKASLLQFMSTTASADFAYFSNNSMVWEIFEIKIRRIKDIEHFFNYVQT